MYFFFTEKIEGSRRGTQVLSTPINVHPLPNKDKLYGSPLLYHLNVEGWESIILEFCLMKIKVYLGYGFQAIHGLWAGSCWHTSKTKKLSLLRPLQIFHFHPGNHDKICQPRAEKIAVRSSKTSRFSCRGSKFSFSLTQRASAQASPLPTK